MNELQQPYVIWYMAWRKHLAKAKNDPTEREGYLRAALLANTMYVIHLALYRKSR